MAADVVATGVAKTTTVLVLTIQDKGALKLSVHKRLTSFNTPLTIMEL